MQKTFRMVRHVDLLRHWQSSALADRYKEGLSHAAALVALVLFNLQPSGAALNALG